MNEIYNVIAGFGLDYYIESKYDTYDITKIYNKLENNLGEVISKISKHVEEKVGQDRELVSTLDKFYNNNFLDYLAHFSLVNGNTEITDDIKSFILFCNRLTEECVKDIIESII